jgi:hypothetical protein
MILICSCHQVVSDKEDSRKSMTRHDEVIQIIFDYNQRKWQEAHPDEANDYLIQSEKIDPEINYESAGLIGLGSMLRGPLTKEQVEQEVPQKPDSSGINDSNAVTKRIIEQWKEFLNQYREGDEFYFHKTNSRTWGNLGGGEGYILIRKNECLGQFLTRFN